MFLFLSGRSLLLKIEFCKGEPCEQTGSGYTVQGAGKIGNGEPCTVNLEP